MSPEANHPDDDIKHEGDNMPAEAATSSDAPPAEPEADGTSPTAEHEAAPPAGEAAPAEEAAPAQPDNKQWYVVKVASGREESIKEAIERRVKIEGLEDSFGQIVIPVERRTELTKGNKRVIREMKLMPGYLLVNVEFNERILYLFRETSGVGDFVGGGPNKPPQPMQPHEIERWLGQTIHPERALEPPKSKFSAGDRVRVKDGTFAGMEGVVKEILEQKGTLVVELTIFGRPVGVELEYWQVDFV
jgi:transcriptional antiterminator NusG